MSEKAKVSQEVANILDDLTRNFTKKVIIDAHVRNPNGWNMDDNKALNGLDLDILVRALYNGYTIEGNAQEQVLEWFKFSIQKFNDLKKVDATQMKDWDKQDIEEHHNEVDYFRIEISVLKQVLSIFEINT
ncbi:hypothetical protein C3943_02155 [Lysinibacillus sp. B2A1]|nr:hypothetical protein C3943_02155 [Lysinibacillus sp. B2A1]